MFLCVFNTSVAEFCFDNNLFSHSMTQILKTSNESKVITLSLTYDKSF